MSRCFIILGMHCSGVEDVANVLEKRGVFFGKKIQTRIKKVNEKVLEDNGGSWHNLPNKFDWSPENRIKMLAILEVLSKHKLFGISDPRIVFLESVWRQRIKDCTFIGVIKDYKDVACALSNDIIDKRCLWRKYNDKILELERSNGRIPSVNMSSPDSYKNLERLISNLRI